MAGKSLIHSDDIGLRRVALTEAVNFMESRSVGDGTAKAAAEKVIAVAEVFEKYLNEAKNPEATKEKWAEWLETHPDEAAVITEVLFEANPVKKGK